MEKGNDWHTAIDEAYDRVVDVLRQEWASMEPSEREKTSLQRFVLDVTEGMLIKEDPTVSEYCYLPDHIGNAKVVRVNGQCPVCFDTTYPMEYAGGDDRGL